MFLETTPSILFGYVEHFVSSNKQYFTYLFSMSMYLERPMELTFGLRNIISKNCTLVSNCREGRILRRK
jgi:hypothetical protein